MTDEPTGLLAAMLAAQAEAPTLKKDATNPHYRSKYAPLDTIVETIGPILHKHGLVWTTKPSYHPETGAPTLKYRIAHAPSGESDEGEMPLLLSKADAQGQGSAITYARRYALCAVLNLVADDDDDGNSASAGAAQGGADGGGSNASAAQKKLVRTLFTQKSVTKGEAKKMLASAGVTVADGENPRDAVDRLRWPAVSELIDFLKQGPVRTGESDAPADPGDFAHEPAGEDDHLAPEVPQ